MTEFPPLDPSTRITRLAPPDDPPSIVLDTDAYNEIDDQFAIAYALNSAIDVEAIYAAPFHNARSDSPGDGMERSYAEIERLLDRLDRSPDGFAFRGSDRYLPAADEPVESPAVDDLIDRAHGQDEPLYVVAIGAPTTVASALLRDPSLVDEIVVVWLGGQPHDWHTAREFNLKQDIHASRLLFDSGVPLVQVPCKNVAEHVRTTVPELDAHLPATDVGEFLFDRFVEYGADGVWSTVIWDIVPIGYLLDPDAVPSTVVHSPHLSDELRWSRDANRHFVRVAVDADRDAILGGLFASLESIQ